MLLPIADAYSYQVFPKLVPGSGETCPIFKHQGFFDCSFESLIADQQQRQRTPTAL